MYFFLALALGAIIGAIACLPAPQADLLTAGFSIALGLGGSFVGWKASVQLGMDEVGPLGQLFVACVAAGALVSLYHAAMSERARLR